MSKIEVVLRHTCALAIEPSLSLPDAIALYGSVATIARALRTEMADNGLPRGFAPDLIVLLIDVLKCICVRALAPAATPAMTVSLARAIGQLSTACHLARPVAAKPPKPAPTPKKQPIPTPKPLALQSVRTAPAYPVPAKPIDPKDRALADAFMADMTRRSILEYKRAA